MLKGIIFDLDGVLIHTDHLHYLAWKQISDQSGLHFDEKMNNQLRGVSRSESLEIILRENHAAFSREEKEKMLDQKNRLYRNSLQTLTEADVDPDTIRLLDVLREKKILLAVGSSSKNARFILERIGLQHYFDGICDGTQITHSKPHPEVFLKAAESIHLSPADCAVVDDAFAGIDAGAAAGMHTIGIGDSYFYEKADERIHKLSDLIPIIEPSEA